MVTGNSIRIRWRLKGEKTKARERERKRRKKKKKKEPHTGGEKTGGGEKKGWRHPLGSREATQEANSPITCRTYRGFAIQASPSNTINIPSRMPGIHAAAESSICDGQRENDGRKDAAGGQGWKRIPPPPPLPGIRIMQPSFFTRSRNEDTDVRKIYLWDEIWRRGQSKRNIPSFETRAANAALLSLPPPLPLHSALETQFPNFLSLSFVCDSSKRKKSNS